MADTVRVYDTTLRDGMQGQGMSLSVEERLRVAARLDDLGIAFIEAGFPGSNPKEAELFTLLERERFSTSTICAFGTTRRRNVKAEADGTLRVLAECSAPVVTLVGKTWKLHVERVTKVSPARNLKMIAESIAFLRREGKRVIYDAEHFFDAFRDDPAYALECIKCAADAGSENVTLCDTNGSSLPQEIASGVDAAGAELGGGMIGIHAHNDLECGVANSITAVEHGAGLVQGTMNGYGERCGNANLISIIPILELKLGIDAVGPRRLAHLTQVAHFMDEICNLRVDPNQPFVGRNAFAHKGGLHAAGVLEDSTTFEHVDPASVGNRRDVLVSELAGRGTLKSRAGDVGVNLSDDDARRVLGRLKSLEHRGYHYEAADGSFELLLRRETGRYEPLFRFESFRVITDKTAGGDVKTEATIKIRVGEKRIVKTAEGNGPVNALDSALRDAIGDIYPHLRDIELVNYKVRILDENKGTAAVTRVLIDAGDKERSWGSIGVSENIIEASWEALVDSLEYPMQPGVDAHNDGRST